MPSVVRGRASGTYFKGYIEGGPELTKKLQALEKGLRDDLLKEATLAGAEVIAEEWRTRIRGTIGLGPGTAHYAESIEARSRAGRNGATATVGIGTASTSPGEAQPREYAPRLEFGSSTTPAKPTLRPAFDNSMQRALDAMGDKCWELIERVV